MSFNSFEFLIFLPIVFLLYWYIFQKNLKIQNLFLVIVSYIFYGWWDWHFLYLIALTSFLSWLSGIVILKIRQSGKEEALKQNWCKGITFFNIALNLAILGVFKYYNFFVDSFIRLFSDFGIHLEAPSLQLILPVGISFYTFQALSYTIDVYKKTLNPTRDIMAFFAYISFFPQLVAGPIERATNLLPQFYKSRHFQYNQAVDGLRQMLWGFFKKIVVADNCASMVNVIFKDYQSYNSLLLLCGAFFFTFQIYCDFSGYSDIAIGTARLFGIDLKRNFHFPYFSRDIAEFWRRWHISLNTWFRDYVYIPLGGSRCGKLIKLRNTFVIFTLSGLWHGANWTYLVWGIYHALLFIPLMLLNKNRKFMNDAADGKLIPSFREISQIVITFIFVMIGWVIFRAESISQGMNYLLRMFQFNGAMDVLNVLPFSAICFVTTILFIIILLLVEWIQRTKEHALCMESLKSAPFRWSIYFSLLLCILLFPGKQETFIYFQF